jgi:hypothetical protein
LAVDKTTSEILSLARSGATRRAWDRFVTIGLDRVTDDPATLTLKGRLLKDQARVSTGEAAAKFCLQSARAYADAAALRPDSYPLINAATMSLFAGQPDHMALLVQQVLAMLDTGVGAGETPYWHEATRAEALFLLGRQADAQAALDKAVAAAPEAWEDRAATLRQFRQIAAFRRESSEWLADYAPPTSLYFKGLIGVGSDDLRAADQAHEAVNDTNAGFGYGALAAGADILVAEALIENGAELHVVLPIMSSAFRAQSVAPYGDAWLPRFDRLFEHAASVTIVGAGEMLTDAAITLAAQVAKGGAILNARRLEGSATGLELNDHPSATFDASRETFVSLERSAQLISAELGLGQAHFMLVSDEVGDPENWVPIADGFFVRSVGRPDAINALLLELKKNAPQACCAVDILAGDADLAGTQTARLLRLAQCASHGTTVASASTALAMLSHFPAMSVEPLGELPDAGGAIEIYAIQPAA